MVGNTPLLQLQEWSDRNNAVYSQILLCISPELQTSLDHTNQSAEAWSILTRKFQLKDLSRISIIRTRYDNYHMQEGQSVSSYVTTMKEFKIQLEKMGESIADSTHAATLLRNVPGSWRLIAQTIQMITNKPDDIEERLEAHKADLNAIKFLHKLLQPLQLGPIQPKIPFLTFLHLLPFHRSINLSMYLSKIIHQSHFIIATIVDDLDIQSCDALHLEVT